MYATRSPRPTPIAWRADDHRSHRSKNSSYVSRTSPSTTPSRSPYSLRVLRANSRGVSGVSMCLPPSRVEHQREVGGLDADHECAVGIRLELHRSFVHERVNIVDCPVPVALDAKPVAKALVPPASLEQIGGPGVDGLQDVELHGELSNGLGIALGLDQPLDLGFEVGDLLLVVVHPSNSRDECTSGSNSSWRPRRRRGWR